MKIKLLHIVNYFRAV
jgi:hypothetical protein